MVHVFNIQEKKKKCKTITLGFGVIFIRLYIVESFQ